MEKLAGIEKMRTMVEAFNNLNESFNLNFSMNELEKLYDAWVECEYDIPPSEWKNWQVQDALSGFTPQFRDATEDDPRSTIMYGYYVVPVPRPGFNLQRVCDNCDTVHTVSCED